MNAEELNLVIDGWRKNLSADPHMGPLLQDAVDELSQDAPPVEFLETLIEMLMEMLESPASYDLIRQEILQSGAMDAEDIPEKFDESYVMLMMCALDLVRDGTAKQGFAHGGLASLGRHGDSMLAHINPMEARMLIRNGGSGTINPYTGLPEFGWASKAWKKVKNVVKKVAGPVLSIASMIPGPWQPWAMAGNALLNASKGNWLGAALSGIGAFTVPGGFGGFGAAGDAAGLTGGLDMANSFGAPSDVGAGMAGGGYGAAGSATPTASLGSLGGTGSGISGGLSMPSFSGLELAGAEMAAPAMENLGGLGGGMSGSIADVADTGWLPKIDSETADMLNTARKGVGAVKTAYSMLNPPEPEEFSQRNTQTQMRQLGGGQPSPPPDKSFGMANFNPQAGRSFGLGGMQSRGFGQMARFNEGGLAAYVRSR